MYVDQCPVTTVGWLLTIIGIYQNHSPVLQLINLNGLIFWNPSGIAKNLVNVQHRLNIVGIVYLKVIE